MLKKLFKTILVILLFVVIAAVALFAWLSIAEYNPDPIIDVPVEVNVDVEAAKPSQGQQITVIGWNVGYCGLGQKSDFFMDGGENVAAANKEMVKVNMAGVYNTLFEDHSADIYMLQEVDKASSRTYNIDQRDFLGVQSGLYNCSYALNYSCPFVPFPLPPIGKVNSGLLTTTQFEISNAERQALPCPFSWPVSTANLKRCLLVSYLPIENSDKNLVVVNLHLEAYDSGEGKIAQTKQLREFIQSEYDKGNYVIAGGDFNQIFPGGLDKYPNEHPDLWEPGIIENDIMPEGWSLAYDLSNPTCRLLNQPYDPSDTANTQYYVIDGFILSPNVELNSVETLQQNFVYSDHNPVMMQVTLK